MILTAMCLFDLKDCQKIPAAHRMLKEVLISCSDQGELQGKVAAKSLFILCIPVLSPNLSPIPFGVINPSGILAYGFLSIH